MLEMQGGFDAVQLGIRPMNPGLPLGRVPARAGEPEAVVNW
jgi:hypothetical protein